MFECVFCFWFLVEVGVKERYFEFCGEKRLVGWRKRRDFRFYFFLWVLDFWELKWRIKREYVLVIFILLEDRGR